MKEGYAAQVKSIVMLKNRNKVLPVQQQKTVYIPKRQRAASRDMLGNETPARLDYPINVGIVKKYLNVTDNPAEADFALAVISSPSSGGGYDAADAKKGGTGYVPISLQYGPYKADVRPRSEHRRRRSPGDVHEPHVQEQVRGRLKRG